jgi:hypothetical protein
LLSTNPLTVLVEKAEPKTSNSCDAIRRNRLGATGGLQLIIPVQFSQVNIPSLNAASGWMFPATVRRESAGIPGQSELTFYGTQTAWSWFLRDARFAGGVPA